MARRWRTHFKTLCLFLGMLNTPSFAQTTFEGLGDLPGGDFYSIARAVSADGRVVVGESNSTAGYSAFYWTPSVGMISIVPIGRARDVSSDGIAFVGVNHSAGWVAFRSTPNGLTNFPGTFGEAYGVSANGGIVVGYSTTARGTEACFWPSATQRIDLGDLPGGQFDSRAYACSADGSVIVGVASVAGASEAFRWTAATGMQGLGPSSQAFDVSADGSVIVGRAIINGHITAGRWTAQTGWVEIDPARVSYPRAVSADGTVIVGDTPGTSRAFIWDAAHGVNNLQTVLTALGANLSGWTLVSAEDISDDKTTIVGYGFNPAGKFEAWRARNVFLEILDPDTDGDGIPDTWETNGIPADSNPANNYMLPGADPLHKNLWVEVDGMTGLAPAPPAGGYAGDLDAVVQAFKNAPVSNPDGRTGIDLILQYDERDIEVPANIWPANCFPQLDAIKRQRFGTPTERQQPNWNVRRAAKARAFRYCLFADRSYDSTGRKQLGVAEVQGDDLIVTLGWENGGTVQDKAATFMHELGHTLGLRHGGNEKINYKPNYPSIMNYSWTHLMLKYPNLAGLDYSHGALGTLLEFSLDERAGIGGATPNLSVPVGPPPWKWARIQGPVNWDRQGTASNQATIENINYLWDGTDTNEDSVVDLFDTLPIDALHDHNDWLALKYRLYGSGNFAEGLHAETTVEHEITQEVLDALDQGECPSLWANPQDTTVCAGANVTFDVEAAGIGTLTYQWRKDMAAIPGATGETLALNAVQPSDAGTYDVVVSSACGVTISPGATLTVPTSTSIQTQPVDQTACEGQAITFSVTVQGAPPVTYQWRKDQQDISGATDAVYTINPVTPSAAGDYYVVVTTACGAATSDTATLTVSAAPHITQPPASQTVCDGSTATFAVTATGVPPPSYQWRKNGVNLVDNGRITGATTAVLRIQAVGAGDAGDYDAVVANPCGTVTSEAASLSLPSACAPPPAGIVGWWPAEGDAGDWQADHDGTATPSTTYTPGYVGQAFLFDGNNDGVTIPDAPELHIPTTLTVEFWVRADSDQPAFENIPEDNNGAGPAVQLVDRWHWYFVGTLRSDGRSLLFGIDTQSEPVHEGAAAYIREVDIFDNAWHHVAGTYDGFTVRIYLDGNLIDAQPSSRAGPILEEFKDINLGFWNGACFYDNDHTPPCRFFRGAIDELTIYNRVLSGPEIKAIHDARHAGKCRECFGPAICAPPADQTVCAGGSAAFNVTADGPAPLAYQWRKNGVPLTDGGNISGATTPALTINPATLADAGAYTAAVSNACGESVSGPAFLTVPLPADLNCDAAVDFFDIDAFVLAVLDPAAYAAQYPNCDRNRADVNCDGTADFFDIDPFIACVLNGGCP